MKNEVLEKSKKRVGSNNFEFQHKKTDEVETEKSENLCSCEQKNDFSHLSENENLQNELNILDDSTNISDDFGKKNFSSQKNSKKIFTKISTKTIAFTALFTALTYAMTMIAIPNGVGGFVNFGDSMILICAFVMNPFSAGIAGALGACLADVTLGYSIWAPWTLMIKMVMGIVAGFSFWGIKLAFREMTGLPKFMLSTKTLDLNEKLKDSNDAKNKKIVAVKFVFNILVCCLTELIMVFGYFGASCVIFNTAEAVTQFVSNFIQMAIGIAVFIAFIYGFRMDKIFNKFYLNNK